MVGEKCVSMDDGSLAGSDSAKEDWKCQYERLLNVENASEKESLSNTGVS